MFIPGYSNWTIPGANDENCSLCSSNTWNAEQNNSLSQMIFASPGLATQHPQHAFREEKFEDKHLSLFYGLEAQIVDSRDAAQKADATAPFEEKNEKKKTFKEALIEFNDNHLAPTGDKIHRGLKDGAEDTGKFLREEAAPFFERINDGIRKEMGWQ